MSTSVPAGLGRIFISYRREETAYPAAWLFDRLVEHFGRGQIFKDIDSIPLGDDFVEVITSAVASCDVLLALIGDRWLTITGDDGQRRLDHPDDFVRLEIQAALTRDIRVIPILVEGAQMPRAAELPDDLAKLERKQALDLSPARFTTDMNVLLRALDGALSEVTTQRPPAPGDVEPTPLPSDLRGWLELPKSGDAVGSRIEVRGYVTGRLRNYKLWIAHRRDPQGRFWPKHPEIRPDNHGDFSVVVIEGGPPGRVTISLLAVPVSRSRQFEKWLQDGKETDYYPGIDPTDTDGELASVVVSYTPDA